MITVAGVLYKVYLLMFSPRVNFLCRQTPLPCPYRPRVLQQLQSQTLTAIVGHTEIVLHYYYTLIGLGSAALAAAVLYPGKAT